MADGILLIIIHKERDGVVSIEQFTGTIQSDNSSQNGFNRLFQPYIVTHFTESQDPLGALDAQRLQGESYVRFGIAHESVLDDGGSLPEWLDHARGDNITYYVATPNGTEAQGWGSGRLIDGELESLAVYEGCESVMYPEQKEFLLDSTRSGRIIREVGAMALSQSASSLASFCIVRDVVQHAIRNDTQELLMGRQTPQALRGFKTMFGSSAVQQVGESAELDAGGGLKVELTPVCADACGSLDSLLSDINNPLLDERRRSKLSQSLLFLADGLHYEDMSEPVREYITQLGFEITKRN